MPRDLDLSYLGIVPDDRDPQAVFDSALASAQAALPTWVPRNGNVEVVLMEALSIAVADAVYSLNRIPPVVLEAVLGLYGVPRGLGDQAVGAVTITFDDIRSLEIPAGSVLQDPTTGLGLYVRDTTTVTEVDTITAVVVATDTGAAANQIPVGTSLDMIDVVPYAVEAVLSTAMSGGTDPEDDAAYYDRAATVFARVTSSLVVPTHFTAFALEDTRVLRAATVDQYAPGGTVGLDLGHVTVYVYGAQQQIPAPVRAELQASMQALSSAMLTVHVEPAAITTQAVDVTVVALAGYAVGEVDAAIVTALGVYLNTDSWAWGGDVIVNEIITVVSNVEGVDYVSTVTVPAGTIAVGIDGLVTAGAITVTVS
jgi:uncharacterized phage protein gp47/JayE